MKLSKRHLNKMPFEMRRLKQIAEAHVRLTIEVNNPRSPLSFMFGRFDHAQFFELARIMKISDLPNDPFFDVCVPGFGDDKYAWTELVSHHFWHLGTKEIVLACDSWMVRMKDKDLSVVPSEHPDRVECWIFLHMSKQGGSYAQSLTYQNGKVTEHLPWGSKGLSLIDGEMVDIMKRTLLDALLEETKHSFSNPPGASMARQ